MNKDISEKKTEAPLELESTSSDNAINEILNVNRAKELYKQGESLTRKGNYQQAICLLKEAINLDKNNADYYSQLGIALSYANASEETEAAEAAFLKAIELKPTVANYHTELGLFYKEIGHIDKSQKALEQAVALDAANARAKRALATVRELICTFKPTKEKFISTKTNDTARLNELKASIKEKSASGKVSFVLLQQLNTKILVACFVLLLALLASITGVMYLYNYWLITSNHKLSETDLTQPNYVAIKIVQTFPSSTKGLSIKETVDQYLKEQNISIHNWVAVKESKAGHYIVIITFTKNGGEQSAFWTVELDKKVCKAENILAKQFSAN
ncbi:MAG: hypothetical protein FD167_1036 [bacterium]|nr:MAG: hypothetical protein FD167_1036 [bacterium]